MNCGENLRPNSALRMVKNKEEELERKTISDLNAASTAEGPGVRTEIGGNLRDM